MMNTEKSFKQKRRTDATRELPAKKIICLSRSRPVLCLARGLPRDHNATTAILEIPEDAPHGLLLICSHSACAKSQRRFRYCKVCDIPVAKKNFISLHGHGIISAGKDVKITVDNVFGMVRGSVPLSNRQPGHVHQGNVECTVNDMDNQTRKIKKQKFSFSCDMPQQCVTKSDAIERIPSSMIHIISENEEEGNLFDTPKKAKRVLFDEHTNFMKNTSPPMITSDWSLPVNYKDDFNERTKFRRTSLSYPRRHENEVQELKKVSCRNQSKLINPRYDTSCFTVNLLPQAFTDQGVMELNTVVPQDMNRINDPCTKDLKDHYIDSDMHLPIVEGEDLIAFFEWIQNIGDFE